MRQDAKRGGCHHAIAWNGRRHDPDDCTERAVTESSYCERTRSQGPEGRVVRARGAAQESIGAVLNLRASALERQRRVRACMLHGMAVLAPVAPLTLLACTPLRG